MLKANMECYWSDPYVTIFQGDALQVLRFLPQESIQTVITSPPYLGLRQYSGNQDMVWGGDSLCQHSWEVKKGKEQSALGETSALHARTSQALEFTSEYAICSKCGAIRCAFGAEPDAFIYIQHSVKFLREIKRVLKPDGVVWWNIGSSYIGKPVGVLKPLDDALIPQRLAIDLQEDGWYVRSWIIWNKPNCLPESLSGWRYERHKVKIVRTKHEDKLQQMVAATGIGRTAMGLRARQGRGPVDGWQECPGCPQCSANDGYVLRKGSWRPTDSWETILMLTKTDSYFADGEPVREPLAWPQRAYSSNNPENRKNDSGIWAGLSTQTQDAFYAKVRSGEVTGRNLRSVWTMPTAQTQENHYAAFPDELPRKAILASTSEQGNCPKCGKPWVRCNPPEKVYNISDGIQKMHKMRTDETTNGVLPGVQYEGWTKDTVQSLRECSEQNPLPAGRREAKGTSQRLQMEESGRGFKEEAGISENTERQNGFEGRLEAIQPNGERQRNDIEEKTPSYPNPGRQIECEDTLSKTQSTIEGSNGHIYRQGLATDFDRTREPLQILPGSIHPRKASDGRPYNSVDQAGEARQKQYSGSMPSLQFKETQPSNSFAITGWLPSCKHKDLFPIPAIILDPFCGTGTTLAAAKSLGRKAIGIEISEEYCRMAQKKVERVTLPLPVVAEKVESQPVKQLYLFEEV